LTVVSAAARWMASPVGALPMNAIRRDLLLAVEGLGGGPVVLFDDHALARGHRQRGVRHDLSGQAHALGQCIARLDEPVEQPVTVQVLRIDVLARQRHLHRDPLRYQPRQPDQAAGRRSETAPDLGQPESGFPPGDHQIAGQHRLEATGERETLDRRDQRLHRRCQRDAEQTAALHRDRLSKHERLQIHPGAERAGGSGQDGNPQVRTGIELVDRSADSERHLAVDGVGTSARLMVMTMTPSSTSTRTLSGMGVSSAEL